MPRKLRSLTVEEFDHVKDEMEQAALTVFNAGQIVGNAYGAHWSDRFLKLHRAITSLRIAVGDRQALHPAASAPAPTKEYLWQGIRRLVGRPYVPGECLTPHIYVSQAARRSGSPRIGDMICRNSLDDAGWWLVEQDRFREFAEEVVT